MLEHKIHKIPQEVLDVLPEEFIEELENYEKACSENAASYERKNRLVDISSSLKVLELSKRYPQEYIDVLWSIYPCI